VSDVRVADTAAGSTTVLVVDDHLTFSELLSMALGGQDGLECVGTAHSAAQALDLARALRPEVVIMDVRLGEDDGVATTALLTQEHPGIRVVVLTAHADTALMRRAADAGACCLLPKNGALSNVLGSVRAADSSGFVVDPTLLRLLVATPVDARTIAAPLTGREREVLDLLADGNDPTAIARRLGIAVSTCRGYVKALLMKLGAHTQLEAVAVARRHGLLDAPPPR
jgi:DNA-binding NarL/FixJ family response regulator